MTNPNRAIAAVALLLAALLAWSCHSASEPQEPTGGETHFLTRCEHSGSCGSLDCLCGVCTLGCGAVSACSGLPGAQCASSGSPALCADSTAAGVCDVSCAADGDCAALSADHRCEQGHCRAPEPGACSQGQTSASEVMLLGDSFFAATHEISADLETLAQDAGALASGEHYRDYSRLTNNALALSGNGMADEYASGMAEASPSVVIMNGGGADVLLGSCANADAACPVLVAAADAARALFAQMASDGVQQVIYVFYPNSTDPSVVAKLDALRPLIQGACAASAVPCHWLDLRTTFEGNYDSYLSSDGLDPSSAGSQATAEAIWAVMRRYCVAQ